jgi:hypothetical protein
MDIKTIIKEEISSLFETREQFGTLYHGTSKQGAEDIINNGIDIDKSEGGYFGKGFYCAIEFALAKSNYADFAYEEGLDASGAVLEFKVVGGNILDLRDAEDFEIWKQFARNIFRPDYYHTLVNNGIDGLYDNSFEGVVVFNPGVLQFVKAHSLD